MNQKSSSIPSSRIDAQRFYEAIVVRCEADKILSIVRDISDRKRAEMDAAIQRRELAHLSRVTTLGELSGAFAHELSQPISAVLLNAQAARHLLAQTRSTSRRCARRSTTSSPTTSAPARSSTGFGPC